MSYRLRIRLAAEVDVAEAAQWYNERQRGLGEKFIEKLMRPSSASSKILSHFQSFSDAMKSGAYLQNGFPIGSSSH
jgi:hypothetical protein